VERGEVQCQNGKSWKERKRLSVAEKREEEIVLDE